MKAYKVVRVENQRLYSSVIPDADLRVEYIPGEKVCGEIGELFVFDLLERAQKHCLRRGDIVLEIWECETGPQAERSQIAPVAFWCGCNIDVWNFWQRKPVITTRAPTGTLTTPWVKLLRKVER